MLILNSLPLGAVQMKHTSILVRHCNLLMLQVGRPGDGASVSFWMDVQVFSYYGHKWKARAKATYDTLLHERKSDPQNIRAPTKECPEDSLLNKGVRRSWRLYDDSGGHLTFETTARVGIDDVSQTHDHDLSKTTHDALLHWNVSTHRVHDIR